MNDTILNPTNAHNRRFSEFGSLRLDADVRLLVSWCKEMMDRGASRRGGPISGLERLKQINRLVGLIDLTDLKKVVQAEGRNWRLKKGEIKGYLNLKEQWGEQGEGCGKKQIEDAIRRLPI